MKTNSEINKYITISILITSLLCIFTVFGLNIAYRNELFGLSLNIIHSMQTQNQFSLLTFFHNLMTLYAGTEGTFVLMVLVYVCSFKKLNVAVIAMYMCANVYIMAFVKVVFLDPRPYIFNTFVKDLQWRCQPTYGFPSGHTWILLLLHQPLVTDVLGCGPFRLGLVYTVFLAVFVPWSRMYLGSHTADQLITGLLYSFAFLVIYRYFLRRKLFHFIAFLLQPSKKLKKFLIILAFHLTFLIPPIILYQINTTYRDVNMEQFYKTKQACGTKKTIQQKMGAEISDAAIGNIFMGFVYGYLLLKDKFGNENNSLSTAKFLIGQWEFKHSKIRNCLLKKGLLYGFSILLTAGSLYFLIGLFVKQFYLTYFLKVIAWNAMIILWVRFIPEIAVRINLIQQYIPQNQQVEEASQIVRNKKFNQNCLSPCKFVQNKDQINLTSQKN